MHLDLTAIEATTTSALTVGVIGGALLRGARKITKFIESVDGNTKAINDLGEKMEQFTQVADGRLSSIETISAAHDGRISHLETASTSHESRITSLEHRP